MSVATHYNFWIAIILMMIGLYPVIGRQNLVKKMIGLGLFQTGLFLLYVSMGKVYGATAPVFTESAGRDPSNYTNAIPTALILTGIVVSVSTLAVALAIIVCIQREYGTIEMDEIEQADHDAGE